MKRLTITRKIGTLSAAGLLALAGVGAAVGHATVHAAAPVVDTAQVQSGDQSAPDTAAVAEAGAETPEATATTPDAPGGPDVQSGPQN